MIARTDIFNINFYKKERFHGSYKGMHYRIEKYAPEEGDTVLRVTVWPGPYNFDTTPDEQKTSASYPFTDDGLTEVCDYLNKFHTEHFCDSNTLSNNAYFLKAPQIDFIFPATNRTSIKNQFGAHLCYKITLSQSELNILYSFNT